MRSRAGSLSVLATCLWAVAGAWPGEVAATQVHWKEAKFVYQAANKPLADFLREFGASQDLVVVVSKQVEGSVNGKFNLLPASLIEILANSFGFAWYAEGNVLHITPASEARSEVIRLNSASVNQLRQSLDDFGIADRRYPITYDKRSNTALVSGPQRYVELVAQTALSIDQGQAPMADAEVRIFPLKFAWAGDFSYIQGGKDHQIPGVATVLTQLYAGSSANRSVLPQPSTGRGRSPLDALKALGQGQGAANGALNSGSSALKAAMAEAASPQTTVPARSDSGLPQFIADGRMNAVIVRDLPERMKAHEVTIQALDTKPGLVEIEVRVIEVNSDAVDSLGIDWRLRTGRLDLQAGRGNPSLSYGTALSDQAPLVGPNGITSLTAAPNLVLTTVLGDAGKNLIARVNALAQEGRANLLSSPKLMTLDNVEAVMENLSTFFVRVAGNLDANLFDVSVGTSMRVTPLIVAVGAQPQIKLAIRIEDGAVTGQSVDQVPIIRRSTITTQSFISDGQALLIAGYSSESVEADQAGVPGLSRLPGVGRLFRFAETRKKRVDRFFLLTPRVVSL